MLKFAFLLISVAALYAQAPQGRAIIVTPADPWPAMGAVESLRRALLLATFEEVEIRRSDESPTADAWFTHWPHVDAVISVSARAIKEKTQFVVTVAQVRTKSFPKKDATYTAGETGDIPETLEKLVVDVYEALQIPTRTAYHNIKKSVHVTPNLQAYEWALSGRRLLLHEPELADSALGLLQRAIQADAAFVDAVEWQADAFVKLRRYDEAIAALKKVATLDGKRYGVHEKTADVYFYNKDDVASARTEYLKEREIRSMATGALVQVAYCRYLEKDMPAARRDAETAIAEWQKRYPGRTYASSSNAMNLLGLLSMASKDTAKAIDHFMKAASNNPSEVSARKNLARIYEIRREIGLAQTLYRELTQIDPADAYAHLSLANIYYYQDNAVDATIHFTTALAYRPLLENARENPIQILQFLSSNKRNLEPLQAIQDSLGDRLLDGHLSRREEFAVRNAMAFIALYYLGNPSEALNQFQILQASPYAMPRLTYYLAEAQFHLGQYQSALTHYERYSVYADDSYNYGRCYLQMGKIYLKQNKYLEAQLQITKSVRIYPNAESIFHLALALRGNQEPDKSRVEFERAIRIYPNYTDAYIELGKTLMVQDKADSAAIVYAKATEIDTGRVVAWAGLAEAQLKTKQYAAAEQTTRRAMRVSNLDQPHLHSLLGQSLVHQKKFNDAAVEFEKERLLDSNAAAVYYDVATLHAAQKKTQTALSYLEKAFELRFRDFARLDKDPLLDAIRSDATYKQLVERYRQKFQQEVLQLLKGN